VRSNLSVYSENGSRRRGVACFVRAMAELRVGLWCARTLTTGLERKIVGKRDEDDSQLSSRKCARKRNKKRHEKKSQTSVGGVWRFVPLESRWHAVGVHWTLTINGIGQAGFSELRVPGSPQHPPPHSLGTGTLAAPPVLVGPLPACLPLGLCIRDVGCHVPETSAVPAQSTGVFLPSSCPCGVLTTLRPREK
jgi:hypothetical protein